MSVRDRRLPGQPRPSRRRCRHRRGQGTDAERKPTFRYQVRPGLAGGCGGGLGALPATSSVGDGLGTRPPTACLHTSSPRMTHAARALWKRGDKRSADVTVVRTEPDPNRMRDSAVHFPVNQCPAGDEARRKWTVSPLSFPELSKWQVNISTW